MAARYYDDAIIEKIKRWLPDNSKLRVLTPEDTKKFFETKADDQDDKPFKLPMISLYRNPEIKLLSTVKQNKSFRGLKLISNEEQTIHLNVIPIDLNYQLDIYTKTFEEGDEYVRNFLFKFINNPKIIITIPYQGLEVQHVANIRVLDSISDTSSATERLFHSQFTKWTIQFNVQDAFLFSIPYRRNWKFVGADVEVYDKIEDFAVGEAAAIEIQSIEYLQNNSK